ncbi:hypothetical protein OAO87_03765, partial [bacterium]|nr:hypothetical protein [bacterium]
MLRAITGGILHNRRSRFSGTKNLTNRLCVRRTARRLRGAGRAVAAAVYNHGVAVCGACRRHAEA